MGKKERQERKDKRQEKKAERKENKKDVKVSLDTQNVDVEIERKDGKFTAELDTKNFDVQIVKDEDGTEVSIQAEKPFGKFVGRVIRKIVSKRGK